LKWKTLSVGCLFAVLVTSSPAPAQRLPSAVSVDSSPSAVTWDVGFPHEVARLTIAGPAGLRLTRSFKPGEPLTFGLFDGTGQPLPDGSYTFELYAKRPLSAQEREIEAAGQQGGRLTQAEAQQARAGFEAANGPFVIRKSGSFTIQGGQVKDLGGKAKRSAGSGASGKPIGSITAADITDGGSILAGVGLVAGSTTSSPASGELELIFPTDDDRSSVERYSNFLEISAVDDRMDLAIDVATGNVGIGTVAPIDELHIRGINGGIADIFMEDPNLGEWYRINQGVQGLWFDSSAAEGVLKLQNAAPGNSIVVDPLGRVGIGTPTPGGNLHIFGVATTDVFNAVGPDPNGNSFNFGYSGASFGLASGFFNVRPAAGAVAPNPALYFMTGNVDRMIVDNQGFMGVHLDGVFGAFNPAHPIHAQVSGAFLSAGGTWTNASSRALKKDVSPLSGEAAMSALQRLEPVNFTYRNEPEDPHVGFIAEDVPDIVATADRKTLAPMDIVAVLTRVVQEQQKTIDTLLERVERLEGDGSQ
jgi:Chaperone of endosialidase